MSDWIACLTLKFHRYSGTLIPVDRPQCTMTIIRENHARNSIGHGSDTQDSSAGGLDNWTAYLFVFIALNNSGEALGSIPCQLFSSRFRDLLYIGREQERQVLSGGGKGPATYVTRTLTNRTRGRRRHHDETDGAFCRVLPPHVRAARALIRQKRRHVTCRATKPPPKSVRRSA